MPLLLSRVTISLLYTVKKISWFLLPLGQTVIFVSALKGNKNKDVHSNLETHKPGHRSMCCCSGSQAQLGLHPLISILPSSLCQHNNHNPFHWLTSVRLIEAAWISEVLHMWLQQQVWEGRNLGCHLCYMLSLLRTTGPAVRCKFLNNSSSSVSSLFLERQIQVYNFDSHKEEHSPNMLS